MRKLKIIILINIFIIPSLFLLFTTNNTTTITDLNYNEDNTKNNYFQNDLLKTADDPFEPNNNPGAAREISKGSYEHLSCVDDDWYKIQAEKNEEIGVNIYFVHSQGNLDIEIFEQTNLTHPILRADSWDDDEYLSFMASYSGYYYIRIYYHITGPNYNYKLDIFTIGDKFEPNNHFSTARQIYKGYYRQLDCRNDDWYRFYTVSGVFYTVDIRFNYTEGNLDLEIYDNTQSLKYFSLNWNDDESIAFTAEYTDYYYIRVFNYSSGIHNDYEMKVGGPEVTIFKENFETTLSPKWTGLGGNNYMHVSSRDNSPYDPMGSYSLWCGNESTGNYDKKEGGFSIKYAEAAIINDIDLREFAYAELSFDYNISMGFGEQINLSINVLGDHFYLSPKYTSNNLELGGNNMSTTGWQNVSFDLSFFCGFKNVDIIFTFETKDTFDNWQYEGVKIDNIFIKGFKDNEIMGYNLGLSVGDEFYYYFPYINQYLWNEIFNRDFCDYSGKSIKFEIFAIYDRGLYWDVIARFWDPWDDFDELRGTDEVKYTIYKNPLSMKEGSDLFIPNDNVMLYLARGDNYEGRYYDERYDIHHWFESHWNDYNIEYCYDDFRVHLIYMANGVLKGMLIHKNYGDMERIFEMWLGEPFEEGDDEDEEEEEKRAVPGYDLVIMLSLICLVSVITVMKIKKSRK